MSSKRQFQVTKSFLFPNTELIYCKEDKHTLLIVFSFVTCNEWENTWRHIEATFSVTMTLAFFFVY